MEREIILYPMEFQNGKQVVSRYVAGEKCTPHMAIHKTTNGYLLDHLPTKSKITFKPLQSKQDATYLATYLETSLQGIWNETNLETMNTLLDEISYHPAYKLLKQIREFDGEVITSQNLHSIVKAL